MTIDERIEKIVIITFLLLLFFNCCSIQFAFLSFGRLRTGSGKAKNRESEAKIA